MQRVYLVAASAVALLMSSTGFAAEISGEYLEARTCDVYTGPCFANAEMGLAGKKALMAWKIEQGQWNEVSVEGLTAALVVKAEGTLGSTEVFEMEPGRVKSVVLVDEKADEEQKAALVDFVKETAGPLAENVVAVHRAPLTLKNDHLARRGVFQAGDFARIETRALTDADCVCTNEIVYYRPLTDVENPSPAYTKTMAYRGDALNNRWTMHGLRSAFLATFRR